MVAGWAECPGASLSWAHKMISVNLFPVYSISNTLVPANSSLFLFGKRFKNNRMISRNRKPCPAFATRPLAGPHAPLTIRLISTQEAHNHAFPTGIVVFLARFLSPLLQIASPSFSPMLFPLSLDRGPTPANRRPPAAANSALPSAIAVACCCRAKGGTATACRYCCSGVLQRRSPALQ